MKLFDEATNATSGWTGAGPAEAGIRQALRPRRARHGQYEPINRGGYGSSLACTASSFGSPADSKSPVALRASLARGLPFRARVVPAGGKLADVGERQESWDVV